MKRGPVADALSRLIVALQPVDFYAHYECEVIEQHDDDGGTLELKPTNPKLGEGLQRVPVMVAGAQRNIRVQPGAKVLVCFADGDPTKPRVTWWRAEDARFLQVEHQAQTVRIGPGADTVSVELTGGTDAMVLGTAYRRAQAVLHQTLASAFSSAVDPASAVAALQLAGKALLAFEGQASTFLSLKSKVG